VQTVKVFRFAVAPYILPLTSYILHLSLPSSLSNPKVIRASSKDFFISPVGEKNFSREGANFYLHWRCKGTKNPDAKQAFLSFFSDLFEMLKSKENRNLRITVLRSYTVTQFHLLSANFHFLMDIYIILYI